MLRFVRRYELPPTATSESRIVDLAGWLSSLQRTTHRRRGKYTAL